MRHIHDRSVIHRDLKPGNVLIDDYRRSRIGDLGLGRSNGTEWTAGAGTRAYLSPEALAEGEYSPAVDVFAFALVLFELIVGPRAFSGTDFQISSAIVNGNRPSIGNEIPQLSRELITHCWDGNPANRPDFRSVVDQLKDGKFQLLPGVEIEKVLTYVAEIEAMEVKCYRMPINLPHPLNN
jgi:serine/threonine protein kinase